MEKKAWGCEIKYTLLLFPSFYLSLLNGSEVKPRPAETRGINWSSWASSLISRSFIYLTYKWGIKTPSSLPATHVMEGYYQDYTRNLKN